jgi:hypothetical protein
MCPKKDKEIEIFRNSKEPLKVELFKICESCETEKIKIFCKDCQKNLCQPCSDVIHRGKKKKHIDDLELEILELKHVQKNYHNTIKKLKEKKMETMEKVEKIFEQEIEKIQKEEILLSKKIQNYSISEKFPIVFEFKIPEIELETILRVVGIQKINWMKRFKELELYLSPNILKQYKQDYDNEINSSCDYFIMEIEERSEKEEEIDSQIIFAICCFFGIGCTKNVKKSLMILNKCCEINSNSSFAQIVQSILLEEYSEEIHSKEFHLVAFSNCKELSEKKYPPAQYLYSIFCQKHNLQSDTIFSTLLESANEGFSPAQNHLGNIYSQGLLGVKKDLKIAFDWYKKSAENGFSYGQNNLGNCYYTGEGVEKNTISASFWFEKSAEKGDPIAINNLENLFNLPIKLNHNQK